MASPQGADPGSFVTSSEGQLWLGGAPFRFLGTNCYFLQEEGAREGLGWEGYSGRVVEALRKASALGLRVVRGWAFNDDPANAAAIQPSPGRLSEAGLHGVDLAIAAAGRCGVKLLLALGNFWPDYGGVPQYLRWHGLAADDPAPFFEHPALVEHFGAHVERLLLRRNPLTGLRWGADPTILGWELLNEPRGGAAMVGWVEQIARRVRRAAPDHLVLTGGEGLEEDWDRTTGLVDVGSIHLYPEGWGWDPQRARRDGVAWIRDHADRAAALGRPLIVGEFGLSNRGPLDLCRRRRVYRSWLEAAARHPSVAGACSWSFSTDDRPDGWDEFTWTWRDGTAAEDPVNRYADLHREHAARFAAGGSDEETIG